MKNHNAGSSLFKALLNLTFISVSMLFFNISYAGGKTWTGAVNADWGNPGNWNPSSLPGAKDDITIPNTPKKPILATGTYTLHSINVQKGATFTQTGGTLSVLGGSVQISGTFNQTGGILFTDHDFKVQGTGTFNQSGSSLVHLAKNALTIPNAKINISSGAKVNQSGGTIYTKDFTKSSGTFNQTGATALFKVYHDWKPGGGSTFNSTKGTVQFTGPSGGGANFNNGTNQFNNIIVDPGANPGFDNKEKSTIFISGDFTNNSTILSANGKQTTFNFNGTSTQNVYSAITGTTNATFGNIVINNNGGKVLLNSNANVAGNITLQTGTFDLSTFTSNNVLAGGTLKIGAGTTMRLAGTAGGQTGSNFPKVASTQIAKTSTTEYYGSGQIVTPIPTYGNLLISSAGTKTAGGNLNIAGSFTLNTATFVAGNFSHNVGVDWTMTSGTFNNVGSTVNFNGTGVQNITSTGAFNNININKVSGTTNLLSDVTASGTLNFTQGNISTGINKMIIPQGGNVTGASSATGWVNGNLQKYMASAAGGTFQVGDALFYSPVSETFSGAFTPGSIIARVTASADPNISSSTIANKNISRYWNLTKPATGAASFASTNLTFNWNTADNYTPLNPALLKVGNYNAPSWTYPAISGGTINTITATAVTTLGNFAIGEVMVCTVSSGFNYSSSELCTSGGKERPILNAGATSGTFTAMPAGLNMTNKGDITLSSSTPGMYTITNTVAGTCPSTSSTTVKISELSASISYSNKTFCQSAGFIDVTLIGTTGGIFSSTPGLIIDDVTGQIDLANSTPGSYTVFYTVNSVSGCSAFTATYNITVTAENYANIGYLQDAYCLNGGIAAVDFDGTPGGTFSSTPGLSLNATTGDITLASSIPGTYTVTYTGGASGGCAAFTGSTVITITSGSPGTVSYAGSPFCYTTGVASVTITGQDGGTFSSATGLDIDDVTGDINIDSSASGTYTVLYSLGGCYTTTTVTINNPATITYDASPYCGNAASAAVTFAGTTGGVFSSTAGLSVNSASGDITPAASTGGSYIVSYTIPASNGCAVFSTTTPVTITTPLSATIFYDQSPFCSSDPAGQTVTLTGTTGGIFSSLAGLTLNTSIGVIIPASSTPGTYTVTYTLPASGPCPAFVTTTSVTVTPAPYAIISYPASTYCKTTTTSIAVKRTGNASGTYSSSTGLSISATTGAITPSASTPGTYTVTYTVPAGGGCSTFSATTNITITAPPSATIFYSGSPFCTGIASPVAVTQTGTSGGTYNSTAGLVLDGLTGEVSPSTSKTGNYTITYSIAASGGCTAFSTTTSVTITQGPAATISYPGNPFCNSVTTASAVTRTGTINGVYSSAAGLSISSSTGAITPSASTPGTYTVSYTIPVSGSCPAYSTTTSVTITAVPSAATSYWGAPFCTTNSTPQSVNQTGTAGGTYSSSVGLAIDGSTGAITPSLSAAGTYAVAYTIAAAGGCAAYSASASVTIVQGSATISYAGNPFCNSVTTAQSVTRTGSAGGVYSSATGLAISSSTGAITPSSSAPGTYVVTYSISASASCAAFTTTTSVTITAKPTASISYPGSPFCTAETPAAVTRTGTADGIYSSNTGLEIDSITGTISPTESKPGNYTVVYAFAASGGCAAYSATASVSITGSFATIAYAGDPFCNTITTSQPVTMTGTTKGVYSSAAGLSINSSTGAITPSSSTPGNYLVSYTVSATKTCPPYTATTSVTITANPSATIVYTANPYCSNGSDPVVTITGTMGGAFSSPPGLSINPVTGTIAIGSSTPATYSVVYSFVSSGGCAAFSTNTPVTINLHAVWNGSVSRNWHDANNWSCGGVPTLKSNAIIPSGLARYPTIFTGVATTNNLTIQSGASINDSASLTIAGQVYNTGYINALAGKVELAATAAQTISSGLFYAKTIKDLVISNPTGISLKGPLRVTGSLAFGNVNNCVFTTGDSLTLASVPTADAQIKDITNAGLNLGNTINGLVIVERYIPAKRAYRFLTAPVNSIGSIKTNWMENSINPDSYNRVNPNPGYGTNITGAGDAANGFDPTQTHNPSMFTFNNGSQSWVAIPNTSGKMLVGDAYRIIVRGSRDVDMNTNTPLPTPTTLRATGSVVTGNVTLSKTGAGGTPGIACLSSTSGAYNLVANPFPSAINWLTTDKNDIATTIYFFDPNIAGTNKRGGYVAYNCTIGTNSDSTSFADNCVQSGQAFFVQTTGPNPLVRFKETDKTNARRAVFKTAGAVPHLTMQLLLPSQQGTTNAADGAKVYFSNDYENNIGAEDSYKFTNQDENIAVMNNGMALCIEGRKPVITTDSIMLKLWQLSQKNYFIKTSFSSFSYNVEAYLKDKFLSTLTQLNTSGETIVPVIITSNAASGASDRFSIVFEQLATLPLHLLGVKAVEKNNGVEVGWTAESESNMDKYEVEKSSDGQQFITAGTVKAKPNPGPSSFYNWFDLVPDKGDNYYRIKSYNEAGNVKYSSVVKIILMKGSSGITVFPNPVNGKNITLQFTQIKKANYAVSLFNNAGQKVYDGTIYHKYGSANHSIELKSLLVPGIYQLMISDKEEVAKISVLVQ